MKFMGKFNKGVVVGGILGAGMMWLNTTKKGRTMKSEIMEASHKVYGQVKEQVLASEKWDTLTKQQYVVMVTELVQTYAIENGLASGVKNLVTKVLASQYDRVKKDVDQKKKSKAPKKK